MWCSPSSLVGVYGRITGFSISGPLYLVKRAAGIQSQLGVLAMSFSEKTTGMQILPTCDLEARHTVFIWQGEPKLLGVVVEFLDAL